MCMHVTVATVSPSTMRPATMPFHEMAYKNRINQKKKNVSKEDHPTASCKTVKNSNCEEMLVVL